MRRQETRGTSAGSGIEKGVHEGTEARCWHNPTWAAAIAPPASLSEELVGKLKVAFARITRGEIGMRVFVWRSGARAAKDAALAAMSNKLAARMKAQGLTKLKDTADMNLSPSSKHFYILCNVIACDYDIFTVLNQFNFEFSVNVPMKYY